MISAWLVHLYTASGAVLAFLALIRTFDNRYRDAFFWLACALVVDATDGVLARRYAVGERLPWFDGRKLDDIVDYLTYVLVPAVVVWHAALVPDAVSVWVIAAMLLSSAYGFSREDAKTTDHLFTGFPSYWNVVVFYLYVAHWTPVTNAAILLVLSVMVFVPLRYVYPSRTPTWRTLTVVLGVVWAVLMCILLWQAPDVSRPLFWASMLFPAYYVALSLRLSAARRDP